MGFYCIVSVGQAEISYLLLLFAEFRPVNIISCSVFTIVTIKPELTHIV